MKFPADPVSRRAWTGIEVVEEVSITIVDSGFIFWTMG